MFSSAGSKGSSIPDSISSSDMYSLKFYPQRARTQLRKYSFAMRVVKYWNSLPEKIVTSKTLNSFKNRLDKHWEDQDLVFEDFISLNPGICLVALL
jgi:hypothetical protein